MEARRERELYLAETMLNHLSEDVLIGLLVTFATAMQDAGMLPDIQRKRISKLVGEKLNKRSRAA